MIKVIDSKHEFIEFCKENNIVCFEKGYHYSIELPDNLVLITEYSNTMGLHYEVKEVDNKVIIKGTEYPYKAGISYGTTYTFDNSNNQVIAVLGLWGGFNILIKSENNKRDNIETILDFSFYGD